MVASEIDGAEKRPADPRDNWDTLDQAARDAAYNNNAAVADSAKWIQLRNSASADYRAAHPRFLNLPYAPSERTAFDLYPAAYPGAPCLVFVHGGYWQRNSRDLFACFAEGPAAAGWSVAIPGYTLAPQTNLRGIVREIGEALDWLVENGPRYGITGPLVISGWSAGGQLAAFHLAHPGVVGGLAISGIYDLAPLRDTNLNDALKLTDEEIAEFSQLRLPVSQKPLIISFGSAELPTLVNDSWGLHRLRSREGAPGQILPIAGADHFSILRELQMPEGALVRAATSLVEKWA
ncbi:MAG TPA: alpha/beta hydrolase [Xanthobacteraceae bacterium]|nr:alpha/beta hydrolase [Xanthobacteraceae bacterium]